MDQRDERSATVAGRHDRSASPATAMFVQPHFDDIALSCGGVVAGHTAKQAALMVTVFTKAADPEAQVSPFARSIEQLMGGEPPSLIWSRRREEDAAAAQILGAEPRLLSHLDAIYRDHRYTSQPQLRGAVHPDDGALITQIGEELRAIWRTTASARVYLPLAVGRHVDHQVCHLASSVLEKAGAELWFYEDFPYVLEPRAIETRLAQLSPMVATEVDVTDQLDERLRAIAAYPSQLSGVFRGGETYEQAVRRYAASIAPAGTRYGERLWRAE